MFKTVSTRYPLHPDFPLGTTAIPEMLLGQQLEQQLQTNYETSPGDNEQQQQMQQHPQQQQQNMQQQQQQQQYPHQHIDPSSSYPEPFSLDEHKHLVINDPMQYQLRDNVILGDPYIQDGVIQSNHGDYGNVVERSSRTKGRKTKSRKRKDTGKHLELKPLGRV